MSFLVGLDLNDVQVQTDSGNASTTAFTLTVASTTNAVAAYISGVRQLAGTDYSVSGTTITFTTAPPTGTNNIMYVYTKAAILNTVADNSVTSAKIVNGTIVAADVDTSSVAALGTASTFTKTQSGSITALSDGANIAVDLALNNHFSVTLAGNRALSNPTNIVAGTSGSFFITQDGTGSRTLSYGSYYDFATGAAPTLTTTASKVDRIDYIARTTTSLHCVFTGDLS